MSACSGDNKFAIAKTLELREESLLVRGDIVGWWLVNEMCGGEPELFASVIPGTDVQESWGISGAIYRELMTGTAG